MAGRGMPWWLISVASFMTLISTNSLVSIPGEAYSRGVGLAMRSIIGPLLGIPIFFLCIRFYFQARVYTPFSYLERRFDARTRIVGSVAYLVIRLLYLALTLFASAKVFEGIAGWSVLQSVMVVGVIGLSYVFLGGMKAVVWADFIQFFLLVAGLAVIAGVGMWQTGFGPLEVWHHAVAHGRGIELSANSEFFSVSPYARVTLWLILLTGLTDRLFYLSADQMAVQRLLATNSYSAAARSNLFAMLLQVPVMLSVWFVGLVVFAYYSIKFAPEACPAGDIALFRFVASELPPLGAGLFVAGCLGAVMSTLDAGFHSLATVYLKDIHLVRFNPGMTEAAQVTLSRRVVLLIGLATMAGALFIGYSSPIIANSFMETQVFWITFQGILAMWFLTGVLSTRVTSGDILRAFAASVTVTCATVAWYIHSRGTGRPLSFLFVSIPGEVTMLGLGLLPALWRRPPALEKVRGLTLFTLSRQDPEKSADFPP